MRSKLSVKKIQPTVNLIYLALSGLLPIRFDI